LFEEKRVTESIKMEWRVVEERMRKKVPMKSRIIGGELVGMD
jgi:hypothetical protein